MCWCLVFYYRQKGRIELPRFPGTGGPGAAPALAEPSRDRAVPVPALGAALGEAPRPAALSQQWGEVAPGQPRLPPSSPAAAGSADLGGRGGPACHAGARALCGFTAFAFLMLR